jgi:hypothetical protein
MVPDIEVLVSAVNASVVTGCGAAVIVTVIVYGVPGHELVVEVGVTIYWTVPFELFGLVSTWPLIVLPEPAEAPVMLPVIVPMVHVKVLGVFAVSEILGLVPLHMVAVLAVVTVGVGMTVATKLKGTPLQPAAWGVIEYVAVADGVVVLLSVWIIEVAADPDVPFETPLW